MSVAFLIKLIVFLPLFAAVFVGLQTATIKDKTAQYLTSGFMVLSALFSAIIFAKVAVGGDVQTVHLLSWIASGDLQIDWALRVDVLTAVMLIVVTWVSAVVHLYSIGYMSHDEHKPRFMAYLSLFTFAMLMLVTADNFVQIFFGWEGVGLCSYLLIGFWYKKDSANEASMKAFLVNRVGDIGLALGICLIFAVSGTVQFDNFFAKIPSYQNEIYNFLGFNVPLLDLIGLLLFVGCMGKSAQLFLHTWLPDAMEGPTPVSALIHAATMVTAGVFLLARCSVLYEHAELAATAITIIGALTAIFAATVGMVQNDIKRVIAYSTCSQLGYMFFACGVGAYSAAIFHLMTHAFFKALLFLGAGSVIHAMSDEQDMRKMGGIGHLIPWTRAFIWIGSLALAGVPFFAGFYSKDIILESAFVAEGAEAGFAFVLGITAALITAFYSWRLIFMTFNGSPRASAEVVSHVHESPKIMLYPLLLLVAGAIFSGWIGYSVLGMVDQGGEFWRGAIFTAEDNLVLENAHHVPFWVKALPMLVVAIGVLAAYVLYIKNTDLPAKIADRFSPIYKFFLNKWYFDELYDLLFIRTAKWLGKILWKIGDVKIVDGLFVGGLSWLSLRFGAVASRLQTGLIYHYAFAMMLGLLGLVSWIVYDVLVF